MKVVNYDEPYKCSPDQYNSHEHSHTLINMNHGSKEMIGPAHKLNHYAVIGSKAVDHTSLSERKNAGGPHIDVNKNFSNLPKSYNDPQPNDAGEPAYRTLYKKGAKAGAAKGGIKSAGNN